MLMVIFGAGASFDSAQAFRLRIVGGAIQEDGLWFRPPLANDLFIDRQRSWGHLIKRYPQIRPILPLLRERQHGQSVEQVLESLQSEAVEYSERERQLASVRYYLRDHLYECTNRWLEHTFGVTNYESLADQIQRWHRSEQAICMVTFNYDLLLEYALRNFGFREREPKLFLASHPIFKVFKIHGSVNWARLVAYPTDVGVEELINDALSIELSREWRTVGEGENVQDKWLLLPSIAIPVQTKSEFACPSEHLTHLQNFLKQVTKILIIGWQAREAHFLKLLRENLPKLQHLMIVCGSQEGGKSVLDYFIQQVGPNAATAKEYISAGGFTDFVVNRQGDEFFKA
jgi:hypothetical protein